MSDNRKDPKAWGISEQEMKFADEYVFQFFHADAASGYMKVSSAKYAGYEIPDDDGKADAQEVANALKVIDMCGYNLTVDLLRSIAEPLKNSYTALKMLRELLDARHGDGGLGFDPDVLILMDEYIGMNYEIIAYEDALGSVREVLDIPELCSAGIVGVPEINGAVVNRLDDTTCYTTLTLGDNMMRVGRLYDSVYLEYPGLFK